MNKRIIYQSPEGGVTIIMPIEGSLKPLTELEAVDFLTKERALDRASKELREELELTEESEVLEALLIEQGDIQAAIQLLAEEKASRLLVTFTIEDIAAKDVPTGLPFKIVDAEDIPTDRTNRSDWFVDVEDLTDGVGA